MASVATAVRPPVDLSFQSIALEDGVVTRAELKDGYARLFECLRDGGAVGEIWLDLALEPGYAIALAAPDSSGRFPDDGELAEQLTNSLLAYCEQSYIHELAPVYAQQNPETAAQREQKTNMAVACLNERLPDLGQRVPVGWDLETLRAWVYDETENAGEIGSTADLCVNYFGVPWRDLEDM